MNATVKKHDKNGFSIEIYKDIEDIKIIINMTVGVKSSIKLIKKDKSIDLEFNKITKEVFEKIEDSNFYTLNSSKYGLFIEIDSSNSMLKDININ